MLNKNFKIKYSIFNNNLISEIYCTNLKLNNNKSFTGTIKVYDITAVKETRIELVFIIDIRSDSD